MRLSDQKGQGRLGAFIPLAIVAAAAYAAFNVGPAYLANYTLNDKMLEYARLGRQASTEDIRDRLMKVVREEGLQEYLKPGDFKIEMRENARRISCEYTRVLKVLPGWEREFTFKNEVDQPVF
jgi:hypothetical protein